MIERFSMHVNPAKLVEDIRPPDTPITVADLNRLVRVVNTLIHTIEVQGNSLIELPGLTPHHPK